MRVDWFTFAAQIINFVILLLLLRRFLYRPILNAMRRREAEITARYEEAEREIQEAEREAELFRATRLELESQRESLYDELEEEIETRRKTMLLEARNEVESMQARWYASVEHQRAAFLRDLQDRIGQQVLQIAERSLGDLADTRLEDQAVALFLTRLEALEQAEREAIVHSAEGLEEGLVVRTAFSLTATQRGALVEALNQLLADAFGTNGFTPVNKDGITQIRFEQDSELVCGIELELRDRRLGWSLRDYLRSLEEELAGAMETDVTAV